MARGVAKNLQGCTVLASSSLQRWVPRVGWPLSMAPLSLSLSLLSAVP